jgi:hypothetical protein
LFIIELRKTTFSPILSLFRFLSHYEKRLFWQIQEQYC